MQNKLVFPAYIVLLQILDRITAFLALRSGAWEHNLLVRTLGNDPVKLFLFKSLIGLLVYLLVADKNVLRYWGLVLLFIYTVIMIQAIITNITNMVI
ncbi:MAG: hypothetical protein GXO43_01315 [Crenarchaeota archaeon]|nr:hypothetical protein [Thermoproteota archaeon]